MRTLSAARATAQARGLPPKVLPCSPRFQHAEDLVVREQGPTEALIHYACRTAFSISVCPQAKILVASSRKSRFSEITWPRTSSWRQMARSSATQHMSGEGLLATPRPTPLRRRRRMPAAESVTAGGRVLRPAPRARPPAGATVPADRPITCQALPSGSATKRVPSFDFTRNNSVCLPPCAPPRSACGRLRGLRPICR